MSPPSRCGFCGGALGEPSFVGESLGMCLRCVHTCALIIAELSPTQDANRGGRHPFDQCGFCQTRGRTNIVGGEHIPGQADPVICHNCANEAVRQLGVEV